MKTLAIAVYFIVAFVGCSTTKALCSFDWLYTTTKTTTEVCIGGKCATTETQGEMCRPIDGVMVSPSKSSGPNPADVPPVSDTNYTEGT